MTDWTQYLNDKETSFSFKRKKKIQGCKRNRVSKSRYGSCFFNENDQCIHCKRPRKKEHRFDPTTNTIVIHYFE